MSVLWLRQSGKFKSKHRNQFFCTAFYCMMSRMIHKSRRITLCTTLNLKYRELPCIKSGLPLNSCVLHWIIISVGSLIHFHFDRQRNADKLNFCFFYSESDYLSYLNPSSGFFDGQLEQLQWLGCKFDELYKLCRRMANDNEVNG